MLSTNLLLGLFLVIDSLKSSEQFFFVFIYFIKKLLPQKTRTLTVELTKRFHSKLTSGRRSTIILMSAVRITELCVFLTNLG